MPIRSDLVFRCLGFILRGGPVPAEWWDQVEPQALVDRARVHRVLSIAADTIAHMPDVPPRFSAALRDAATRNAAKDLRQEAELRSLVASCVKAGIDILLFKGAALAYSVYGRPDLRDRMDTDLMVASDRREDLHALLVQSGYEPVRHVEGSYVNYQASYILRRNDAILHGIDVHWRLANPEVFGDLPSFEVLWQHSEPLPALAAGARGFGAAHALLIACVHRVAHHRDSSLLLWFYDIHLIAQTLDHRAWQRFLDEAARARVMATCRHSLLHAAGWFHTALPSEIVAELNSVSDTTEVSASYLVSGRRRVGEMVTDLRLLPSWAARSRLMLEHLVPSRTYMRESYARGRRVPLLALYVWRALRGAPKWLARR
jgi:hypothetical protein